MPHFLIDCSEDVLQQKTKHEIMSAVNGVALKSGLFKPEDIKVRVRPFDEFMINGSQESFIHVFSHIMQGRTTGQKAILSRSVVETLVEMFPEVGTVSMNVDEFEKETYCNKPML
ncbi:MAG: 5-carboxymethyl-2-hydroxymuconate Delta-isomerase [Bacteroidota bacterium]